MTPSIEAIVHDRQITVPVPDEIPDGTRVEVRLLPVTADVGIDESQWRTDADSIREWCEWLDNTEPVQFRPADDFDERFRNYNIQAVREQMFGDDQ